MANAFIEIRINLYLVMHLYQLFIVYVSFSSFGGDIDNDANMTSELFKTGFIAINV